MAHSTPRVDGTVLVNRDDAARSLTVGSPAWYAWLEDATTFAFSSAEGSFSAQRAEGLVLASLPQAQGHAASRLSGQVHRSDARPASRGCARTRAARHTVAH